MMDPTAFYLPRQLSEFICHSCGVVRPVSVPFGVPIEKFLADYPCPDCGAVRYPSTAEADILPQTCRWCDDAAVDRAPVCSACAADFGEWHP